MAEGSWEDEASPSTGLSAAAKPFTFSAGASSWTPGGAVAAEPPAPPAASEPAPEPAAPASEAAEAPKAPEAAPPAPPAAKEDLKPAEEEPATVAGGVDKEEKGPEGDAESEEEVAVPEDAVELFDERDHLNVVFIGHVDAGKSTLSGNILYLTGQVDARTIEKFEREAKNRNRESWFLAFIMDTNEEERAKGKTVEVGRAFFDTPKKRFTVLDAPGHKRYVPAMIQGASQADAAVLVISARKGEFETGFERGGQTREHAMLAKTLGVRLLVVVINKMDDTTVNWSEERYNECVEKLSPFLKSSGYNIAKHVKFLPISALTGAGVKEPIGKAVCPWYTGGTLLETLDSLEVGGRDASAPLRVPILDQYTDRGVMAIGKVEAGTLTIGAPVTVMPVRAPAKVEAIFVNDVPVKAARPGENVTIKLKGVNEDQVHKGFVLSPRDEPCHAVTKFEAQLKVLDIKGLMTAGFNAVLHVHTCEEEVTVVKLLSEVNRKTGKPSPRAPMFVKAHAVCTCVLQVPQSVCVEPFAVQQQLGRFTLRDDSGTIAIGKILKVGDDDGSGAASGGAGKA